MLPLLAGLATLFPLPAPDTTTARIVLVRAELFNVDGPGLVQFDHASAAFLKTASRIPTFREPAMGACLSGTAKPEEVEGYLTGAIPILRQRIPGEGITLEAPGRVASGMAIRNLHPLPGIPGAYAATVGGARSGTADVRPMFFSANPVRLVLASENYRLPSPLLFEWPDRDLAAPLDAGAAYALRWKDADSGTMLIVLAASRSDRSSEWIVCAQPAERGAFSIPARLIGALPRTTAPTLALVWLPEGAWKQITLPKFDSAFAAAVHVQGASVAWRGLLPLRKK